MLLVVKRYPIQPCPGNDVGMPLEMDKKEAGHSIDAAQPEVEISGSIDFTAEDAVNAVKGGHAKGVDVAARIIAEHGQEIAEGWTPGEEKRLMRKVDWRLIPIVSLRFGYATVFAH